VPCSNTCLCVPSSSTCLPLGRDSRTLDPTNSKHTGYACLVAALAYLYDIKGDISVIARQVLCAAHPPLSAPPPPPPLSPAFSQCLTSLPLSLSFPRPYFHDGSPGYVCVREREREIRQRVPISASIACLNCVSVSARQGSGSACRSVYGGFVKWEMGKKVHPRQI